MRNQTWGRLAPGNSDDLGLNLPALFFIGCGNIEAAERRSNLPVDPFSYSCRNFKLNLA